MQNKKIQSIIRFAILVGILILINIIGRYFFGYFDLTEDKRYSITEPTKDLVKSIEDKIFIDIYLSGNNIPANYRQLQEATTMLLDQFRSLNASIDYQFVNPNEGTTDEINQMREKLKSIGIVPKMTMDKEALSARAIFPYAAIRYGDRVTSVSLLQNDAPAAMPEEVLLENSINLLEYAFANGFKGLKNAEKPYVLFIEGHGELNGFERADFEKTLKSYYEVQRTGLDSLPYIDSKIDVVIMARPLVEIPDKHKFIIDQYIMNGGKVLFLLDRLNVSLDSLRGREAYVPYDTKLNLDNMLFKYGVRMNTTLALDLQCTKIPQVVGMEGGKPQTELFDWYYHPMVDGTEEHPIVKNIDRVNLFFPTTLDTIQTIEKIKKTILLTTSERSFIQRSPVRVSFEILKYPPEAGRFNKGKLPLAVLLEGEFSSAFKGIVAPEMLQGLQQLGRPFRDKAVPGAKMLVVADGDIAKNIVDYRNNTYQPLGYNPFVRYQFANKNFLLNTIDYMLDEEGITAARMKEVKLRLLDKTKIQEEKTKWQVINILIPLVFLVVFGLLFNYLRQRKFAR
ncbi:MAG: gliding-associated putative ABC transporter substrate-binding component GldG [Saprospiraceae bacterium]|jgi:gliding-associated putative ABC transporter substrate-binding component GldG